MPSPFRHTAQQARLKVKGQTLLTLQDGDHPDEWNESYYTFTDHLGTGTITMDTTGTILSIDLYTPVGDTSYTSRPRAKHRYCGKEKDKESGLYYYGARYYECWTCRFVSVDPLAEKFAQLSSYNYADNSPVTDLDLDGLQGTDTGTTKGSVSTPQKPQGGLYGPILDARVSGINPNFKVTTKNTEPENRTRLNADATNIQPAKSPMAELKNTYKVPQLFISATPARGKSQRVDEDKNHQPGGVVLGTTEGTMANLDLPTADHFSTIWDVTSFSAIFNPGIGRPINGRPIVEALDKVVSFITETGILGPISGFIRQLKENEETSAKSADIEKPVNSTADVKKPLLYSYSVAVGKNILTLGIKDKDTTLVKGPGIPANPFLAPIGYSKDTLNKRNKSLIHQAYPNVLP